MSDSGYIYELQTNAMMTTVIYSDFCMGNIIVNMSLDIQVSELINPLS